MTTRINKPTSSETSPPPQSTGLPQLPAVLLLVPREMLDGLRRSISAAGWATKSYPNAKSLSEQYRPRSSQCLLLDLDSSDNQTLPLIESLTEQDPDLRVLVLGSGEVDNAVAAMRHGASQFLRKPFLHRDLVRELGHLLEP